MNYVRFYEDTRYECCHRFNQRPFIEQSLVVEGFSVQKVELLAFKRLCKAESVIPFANKKILALVNQVFREEVRSGRDEVTLLLAKVWLKYLSQALSFPIFNEERKDIEQSYQEALRSWGRWPGIDKFVEGRCCDDLPEKLPLADSPTVIKPSQLEIFLCERVKHFFSSATAAGYRLSFGYEYLDTDPMKEEVFLEIHKRVLIKLALSYTNVASQRLYLHCFSREAEERALGHLAQSKQEEYVGKIADSSCHSKCATLAVFLCIIAMRTIKSISESSSSAAAAAAEEELRVEAIGFEDLLRIVQTKQSALEKRTPNPIVKKRVVEAFNLRFRSSRILGAPRADSARPNVGDL